MNHQSLATLVAIYRRQHSPRLAAYLDYFKNLGSVDDAIRFACHGKEGRIHRHQHLVGKEKLEQAWEPGNQRAASQLPPDPVARAFE